MRKVKNNSSLNNHELNTLHRIDAVGRINNEDKEIVPGVHFCPDFDNLPICEKSPEWENCTCKTKETI